MAIPSSGDPSAFWAFEQAGWQTVAHRYHDAFASLTTQAIGPLLDAVGVAPNMRVLDIATGPGYVAATAAQHGAQVIGVDFSAAMVVEARQRHPAVEFREGDAEALPFADESFEAVVMNFGLLHLGRPEQALAEAYRVLGAGGRIAFTVWARPEEAVGFGIVLRAIQTYGDMNVPLPPGPPFFQFSEADECRRVLQAAGFINPQVQTVAQVWRLSTSDELFEIMHGSSVRTAALLRAQSPAALTAIRTAMREATLAYTQGNTVELPMPAVLASAGKP